MWNKIITVLCSIIFCFSVNVRAQDEKQEGMQPAAVVVSEVGTGMVAPQGKYIGTVFFSKVSDVAGEVEGKVEALNFEEGRRIKEGDLLVSINADILRSDLDRAMLEYARAVELYKDELITEEEYDARRFEKERLEIILSKKTITAPFDGVIVKKHIERGEWISPGSVVATLAADDMLDIMAEVPQRVAVFLSRGMEVNVLTGGTELTGRIDAVIPSGDISTRTFPVKIKAENTASLIEGMEAEVILPEGEEVSTLTVNRDAVIRKPGQTVIYAVQDARAVMIPVKIVGYKGLTAGIRAEGLTEGMKVVVKGNERLRPGQEVIVQ